MLTTLLSRLAGARLGCGGLNSVINALVTNGISHHYQLDESTFIFSGIRSDFSFLFHFSMKFT